jgi:hypothetical protein
MVNEMETFGEILDKLNQIAKENPETLKHPLLIRDKDIVSSWSHIHDVRITWDRIDNVRITNEDDEVGYPIYPTEDTVQPNCVYIVAFID